MFRAESLPALTASYAASCAALAAATRRDGHTGTADDWLEERGTVIAATRRYPRGVGASARLFNGWCPSLAPSIALLNDYRAWRAVANSQGSAPRVGGAWAPVRDAYRTELDTRRATIHAGAWARFCAVYLADLAERTETRVAWYPVEGPRVEDRDPLHPLFWALHEEQAAGQSHPDGTITAGVVTFCCYEREGDARAPYCHIRLLVELLTDLRRACPVMAYSRAREEWPTERVAAWVRDWAATRAAADQAADQAAGTIV